VNNRHFADLFAIVVILIIGACLLIGYQVGKHKYQCHQVGGTSSTNSITHKVERIKLCRE
jgi:hypothetical protein